MAAVMEALAAGQTLTMAALEAGFASSAHLSAAFKATFGVQPSRLVGMGLRISIAPGLRLAPSDLRS